MWQLRVVRELRLFTQTQRSVDTSHALRIRTDYRAKRPTSNHYCHPSLLPPLLSRENPWNAWVFTVLARLRLVLVFVSARARVSCVGVSPNRCAAVATVICLYRQMLWITIEWEPGSSRQRAMLSDLHTHINYALVNTRGLKCNCLCVCRSVFIIWISDVTVSFRMSGGKKRDKKR